MTLAANGALSVWEKFVTVCHTIRITPYDWNNGIHLDTKRRTFRLRLFIAQFGIILAYEVFLLFRGYQEVFTSDDPFKTKIELLFSIEAYILLNVNQWIIIRNFELYPNFIRTFLRLLYDCEGTDCIIIFANYWGVYLSSY